jgi:nucleotide-binding universal stress UspA family protein
MANMKILLAVDGSRFSDAAVRAVIAQTRPQETEIRVIHVVEPPSMIAATKTPGHDPALDADWWKTEKEAAHLVVENAARLLRSGGFNVTAGLEEGEPKSTILDIARDWRADLIVLGSHGRKGLLHFLVGSVSEAVARHAQCSVEIVRIPPAQ